MSRNVKDEDVTECSILCWTLYIVCLTHTRTDHLIPGPIFFRGNCNTQWSSNKAGQVATLCKCTCITRSRYLPAFTLWKPLSGRLPAVYVTFHDGGESSAACVHQFLFPSGENWCWNVRNAASSFRRVLPKSIEDIWVVFPFQKWTPILWRWPPPRQAIFLPHRGDWHVCEKSFALTDIWQSERLQRMLE